ncbi:MAG: alpha/beta fold hydrolase [bacterium]|nr:alpha/beta fold hydrolase [bacterium]
MRPCHVVEIITPKKYVLNGLWFGPQKPKQVIIFIHGLTGSAFSARNITDALRDSQTAVITFNNRGSEHISEFKQKRGKKSVWKRGGGGHEIFTECDDDIQGAVSFARRAGVKNIYLAGHSTGCQKAVYWASKNNGGRGVKGLILFGPLSDYAIALEQDRNGKLAKSVAYARKLVRAGKRHKLMPRNLEPWFVCDAQRFLSLYTPDSAEEIFTYAQPKKNPRALHFVRTPTLVVLAGNEEHTKRPAKEIAAWFEKHTRSRRFKSVIVPRVGHGFKGGEKIVAKSIRAFIKGI